MRPHGDVSGENTLRVPVVKAAELLGLTEGAVRQRIKRGTLPGAKAQDVSVYVLLNADRISTDADNTSIDGTTGNTTDLRMTIERLGSEVSSALTERIPELEPASASPDARESSPTASEEPAGGGAQAPTEARSWWRFFGLY